MKHLIFLRCIKVPFLLWAVLILLASCSKLPKRPIVIVSKSYEAQTYEKWLLKADTNIIIKLAYKLPKDSLKFFLKRANGILLSGGEDINPTRYGAKADRKICGPFDERRDSLEFALAAYAMEKKIPLLGICRGHQLLNVSQGGTLFRDIKLEYDSTVIHPRVIETVDSRHSVSVFPDSYLYQILSQRGFKNATQGRINSAHHQGVRMVAPNYKVGAVAPDGLAESIEPVDVTKHPFILGVQWHPERMEYESAYSKPIAEEFLEKVKEHYQKK